MPVETVPLVRVGDGPIADEHLEDIHVDRGAVRSLSDELGEERLQPLDVLGEESEEFVNLVLCDIVRAKIEFFGYRHIGVLSVTATVINFMQLL